MVFIMQGGFAMLTAGLCRAKNVVNLMMKNLMDFAIGSLAFRLVPGR
jgi:Amt family ammonium transporter